MENKDSNSTAAAAARFIGVRKRKWGKWVTEIREPGKKSRVWLGSYEKPEMAAAAYDAAAFHFKDSSARLNFPKLAGLLPKPASNAAADVQAAAQEAAIQITRRRHEAEEEDGGGTVPATVGLSPSQIEAIHEMRMDSPKLCMEMEGEDWIRNHEKTEVEYYHDQWDYYYYNSIWD